MTSFLFFINAILVIYDPVLRYTVPVLTIDSTTCGADSSNISKQVQNLRKVDYSVIATSMPHLNPSYRTDTLTRLGIDLRFDASLCPMDSLQATGQLINSTPFHDDCPTLFLVGARKGGTTSLYQYVSKHPDFEGARLEYGPGAGETFHFSARYEKESWEDYLRRFPSDGVMTGDASVGNFVRCEVPKRIFESCGKQAKIVMLLRDPVNRFVSNFLMRARSGVRHVHNASSLRTHMKAELDWFLSAVLEHNIDVSRMTEHWDKLLCLFGPSTSMVFEGVYYVHLYNWLCNFPRENILILNSEEFYTSTTLILKQVYEFLGLKPLNEQTLNWITSSIYNQGNYSVPGYQRLSEFDKKQLLGLYKPFNNALLKMLDWDTQVNWNL